MPHEPLPPELRRIREQDRKAHVEAAVRAGLDPQEAEAHAHDHLAERDHDAYRAPSLEDGPLPGRVEAAKAHDEAERAPNRKLRRPPATGSSAWRTR